MTKKEIYIFKVIESAVFIGIIICILLLLPPEKTQTITRTTTKENQIEEIITEETKRPYWQLFLEWCTAGCGIAIVWVWRKELGITGILGVEGKDPEIQQKEPDINLMPEKNEEKTDKSKSLKETSFSEEWYKKDREEKLNEFLSNYQHHGFFNIHLVSQHFDFSPRVTEELLFDYVNKGILRVDANPKPVFSVANSYENQVIDSVAEYISKNNNITKEIRFAVIGNLEFDAVFETEKSVYLVDVKISVSFLNKTNLINIINRNLECARKFNKQNKILVISIGCKNESEYEHAVRFSKNYKYEDEDLRLLILPVKIQS